MMDTQRSTPEAPVVQEPTDIGIADAARRAVVHFVTDQAARSVPMDKALNALSTAIVDVQSRNAAPSNNEGLFQKVDKVVKSGGLIQPALEDDLLGGTDLDVPV